MREQHRGRLVSGIRRAVGLAAACAACGGCASKTRMMPAPLAVAHSGDLAFSSVAPERRSPTVTVYYATDRMPQGPGERGARYGSNRGEVVRLGEARVRIGPDEWDWERAAAETLGEERPELRVTGVEEFGLMEGGEESIAGVGASLSAEGIPSEAAARFAAELDAELAACMKKDLFVYVPGFNVSFEVGLRRMAEFAHFMGREGVFLTYAWPAHAHPFAYDLDRKSAFMSAPAFRDFVEYLADRTDAERIHVIASSAGAPVVSQTLIAWREAEGGPAETRRRLRLGQVIYAASDQDIDGFREFLLAGGAEVAEHITVYSSSVDLGLVLTRHFGSGDRTIGRLPANMSEADAALLREHAANVTIVDVTRAVDHAGRGDLWAHRYWYMNTWVSSDLLGLLRHGMGPRQRGLVPARDGAMWAFPDDYPEQLRDHLTACGLMESSHAGR